MMLNRRKLLTLFAQPDKSRGVLLYGRQIISSVKTSYCECSTSNVRATDSFMYFLQDLLAILGGNTSQKSMHIQSLIRNVLIKDEPFGSLTYYIVSFSPTRRVSSLRQALMGSMLNQSIMSLRALHLALVGQCFSILSYPIHHHFLRRSERPS